MSHTKSYQDGKFLMPDERDKWFSPTTKKDNENLTRVKSTLHEAEDLPSDVEDKIWADINTSQHGRVRGFTHRIKPGKSRNTVNHGGPFCCANQNPSSKINSSAQQYNDVMSEMKIIMQNPELAATMPPDLLERFNSFAPFTNFGNVDGSNSVNDWEAGRSGRADDAEEEEDDDDRSDA